MTGKCNPYYVSINTNFLNTTKNAHCRLFDLMLISTKTNNTNEIRSGARSHLVACSVLRIGAQLGIILTIISKMNSASS